MKTPVEIFSKRDRLLGYRVFGEQQILVVTPTTVYVVGASGTANVQIYFVKRGRDSSRNPTSVNVLVEVQVGLTIEVDPALAVPTSGLIYDAFRDSITECSDASPNRDTVMVPTSRGHAAKSLYGN